MTVPEKKSVSEKNVIVSEQHNMTCPTWTQPDGDSCMCGNGLHDIVMCNYRTKEIHIIKCYCMTVSAVDNVTQTLVGNCIYNCGLNSSIRAFYRVSSDLTTLNSATCGAYNREGQMCSKCVADYGVPVYTYTSNCTQCSEYSNNWIKYTFIVFFPLTLFYIAILIFNLDTTHSILNSYILFGQILTTPIISRLYEFKSHNSLSLQFIYTVYGIWNLDFGRGIYKPFCLHPDLTTHQVIALDYLIAVYPLLLILLTYLLVKLHDHYRLVVIIWRPFYWCIRCIQKEWNIRASLIDVFATFLLLSNVKLLNVSFDLISVPVTLWNVTGQSLPQKYTHLNGSMEYRGKEHLPYFVLGVAVILVFNVLPILLLCLYPFRWFQKCLNCCSLSRPSLHIFMDAFQGCYKTTPRDYRRLSAICLIFRLTNFLLLFFTINPSYFTLLGMLSAFLSFSTMLVRPYKSETQTNFEGLMFLTLSVLAFLLSTSKEMVHINQHYKTVYFVSKFVLSQLPNVLIVMWLTYKLLTKKMWSKWMFDFLLKKITIIKKRESVPLLGKD